MGTGSSVNRLMNELFPTPVMPIRAMMVSSGLMISELAVRIFESLTNRHTRYLAVSL